ncbi:MAG: hypothetical protein ABIW47_12530 [Ginsengibacter sp.]|jgi:hypothetical protein
MKTTPKKEFRLRSATKWIKTYSGKNKVKGYSKKYAVDKLCAVRELRMIGVPISEEYEKQLQQSVESVRKQRLASKLKRDKESNSSSLFDSDENFAYIIGYTSGGAPYGVAHEEMNIENQSDYLCSSVRNLLGDKSDPELYSLKFGKS